MSNDETEMTRALARYSENPFYRPVEAALRGVNPRYWNTEFAGFRRRWLESLSHAFGDFEVQAWAAEFKSKWVPLSSLNSLLLDFSPEIHRRVLSNEIAFDFDAKGLTVEHSYAANAALARHLCRLLDADGVPFNAYFTGNKGLFVHSFIDLRIQLDERTAKIYSELKKSNGKYSLVKCLALRRWARYDAELADAVDDGLMKDARHLVRACGSVNSKSKAFKIYLGSDAEAIPDNRAGLLKFFGEYALKENDFPRGIPVFKVTQAELEAIIPKDFSLLMRSNQTNLETRENAAGVGRTCRALRAFSRARKADSEGGS